MSWDVLEFDVGAWLFPPEDVNDQFCKMLTNYPEPHAIQGNDGLKLFYQHTPWNNNLVAVGYKRTSTPYDVTHYLIAFSSWSQAEKYFPGILQTIPYTSAGGSGNYRRVDCPNTKVALPTGTPIKLILQALQRPNTIQVYVQDKTSPAPAPGQSPGLPDPAPDLDPFVDVAPDPRNTGPASGPAPGPSPASASASRLSWLWLLPLALIFK